nr:perlwapin-like [Procambarus clarkii]
MMRGSGVVAGVVVLMVTLAVVTSQNVGGGNQGCRYFCRTPTNALYCCEDERSPINRPTVKPLLCPAVGTRCNPSSFAIPCSNDGACPGNNKCCYDVCRRRHICSPPSFT